MKPKFDRRGKPVARSILGPPLLFEAYKKKMDREIRKKLNKQRTHKKGQSRHR